MSRMHFIIILCLLLSGGAAEIVKVDLEPLVDVIVNCKVFVAYLLGR